MNTSLPHDQQDTELAPKFTVRDYIAARDGTPPDRVRIADALRERFTNRYIEPIQARKRGFTMMAVSCLTIEAFESFLQGWESTYGKKSEAAFRLFFDQFAEFAVLRGHAKQFYKHIRCGLLHQAESTGGWRIRRDRSMLFDQAALTINADRFVDALQQVLIRYFEQLKNVDWDESRWENVRNKMNAIVQNC